MSRGRLGRTEGRLHLLPGPLGLKSESRSSRPQKHWGPGLCWQREQVQREGPRVGTRAGGAGTGFARDNGVSFQFQKSPLTVGCRQGSGGQDGRDQALEKERGGQTHILWKWTERTLNELLGRVMPHPFYSLYF